jgi:transcription elongation factor Elf1
MILRIECASCNHAGIVDAETLPRLLTCSHCGSSRRIERKDGARIANRVAFEEWLLGASGAPRVTERKL